MSWSVRPSGRGRKAPRAWRSRNDTSLVRAQGQRRERRPCGLREGQGVGARRNRCRAPRTRPEQRRPARDSLLPRRGRIARGSARDRRQQGDAAPSRRDARRRHRRSGALRPGPEDRPAIARPQARRTNAGSGAYLAGAGDSRPGRIAPGAPDPLRGTQARRLRTGRGCRALGPRHRARRRRADSRVLAAAV